MVKKQAMKKEIKTDLLERLSKIKSKASVKPKKVENEGEGAKEEVFLNSGFVEEIVSGGSLLNALRETGGRQTLEMSAREAKTEKTEEDKDAKKIYETRLYDSKGGLYEDKKAEMPEMRVQARFVKPLETTHIVDNHPVRRRAEMIRQPNIEAGSWADGENSNKYEMTRRRDPSDINPAQAHLEQNQKKYKI